MAGYDSHKLTNSMLAPYQLKASLTANSKSYQASYSGGKYGFTIGNVFYQLGGGGMPTLDFTNYKHVFASSAPSDKPSGATYGTSYTATKDCYLGGSVYGNNVDVYVKINGHKVYGVRNTSSGTRLLPIPFTKLSSGDTVTSVNASDSANAQDQLYIYEEK